MLSSYLKEKGEIIINKIRNTLKKLEEKRQNKVSKRNDLNEEISELNSKIKKLNDLLEQYEKLQNETKEVLEKVK